MTDNIEIWEEILRRSILVLLDDRQTPPYKDLTYEPMYTALYRYSLDDSARATEFIRSLIGEAVPLRRAFLASQLYEHCGICLTLVWQYVDDDTRKNVLKALQSHSVFRHIQEARISKHQCFADVCLGLRPAKRDEVIKEAAKRLLIR